MASKKSAGVMAVLEEIRGQLSALSERVEKLEGGKAAAAAEAPVEPVAAAPQGTTAPVAATLKDAEITPDEVLAISAAIAAYLGVRVHIRQIRLIRSQAWAQEGRVSIQASHRLHI